MRKLIFLFLPFYTTLSFSQKSPIATIPFEINEKGLMIIKLKINGVEVSNFVLDTGSSITVIDDDSAEKLGLQFKAEKAQLTEASSTNNQVEKTIPQEITINRKVKLKGLILYVSDLSKYGDINGIIGFDLFRKYISETIFDKKIIHFYKRINSKNTREYQSIDFVESYCTPEVLVTFSLANGEIFSGKALFDTGNVKSPLIINSTFAEENYLTEKFESVFLTTDEGVNVNSNGISTIIETLKFGEFIFSEMPISLSKTKEGVLAWEGYLGILGLELISKFNFILDYKAKKIYFRPSANFKEIFNALRQN
ncbi:MAG: retropepsin-like aspartic protease [Bacteroidota bacterium]